jgi:hypothetical protein
MKRDPRTNPEVGDVLRWNDWSIHVTKTEPGLVFYRRKRAKGDLEPEAWQTLHKFATWASAAKVKQRGVSDGECVVMTTVANARCSVCGERVECPHSVGLAFYCEAHCVAHKEAA